MGTGKSSICFLDSFICSCSLVSSFFFISSSSLASSTFGEGGLYFDEGEVALACTAGTALGAKLADAMESCFNEFEGAETEEMNGDVTMRKKCRGRKCKNNNKKCPTAEQVKQ